MGKPGNGTELVDVSLSLAILLQVECFYSANGALCWAFGTRLQINSSLATSADRVLLALPALFKLWRERGCFRIVEEMNDIAIIQDLGR
jgi:hypothetical protein